MRVSVTSPTMVLVDTIFSVRHVRMRGVQENSKQTVYRTHALLIVHLTQLGARSS